MITNRIPFTSVQWAVWADQQLLSPDHPAYVIGGGVKVHGHIDPGTIERAVRRVADRHECMRALIASDGDERCLEIHDDLYPVFCHKDLSGEPDPDSAAEAWVQERMSTPFDLFSGEPLWEFAYVTTGPESGFMMARCYHIASDAWGTLIMLNDVGEAYNKILAGDDQPLEPAASYAKFVDAEKRYYESDSFQDDKAYLVERLSSMPGPLFLDAGNAVSEYGESRRIHMTIARESFDAFKARLSEMSVGTAAGFLALLFISLSRHTGRRDVVVGMPVLNRRTKSMREIIGHFTHLLPVDQEVDPDAPVAEVAQSVNRSLRNLFRHSNCPMSVVRSALGRSASDTTLDVTFNHLTNRMGVRYGGHTTETHYSTNLREPRTLGFSLCEFDDETPAELFIDYSVDLFSSESVTALSDRVVTLMDQFVADPSMLCCDYRFLGEREEAELAELSRGPQIPASGPETMHGLFEAAAAERPDADAVVFEGRRLSYAELDRRANSLANLLRAEGLEREARVAVMGLRSDALVTALLGVMKAGCVYVPVDPAYPKERIEWIIQDSGASAIVDLTGSSELDLPIRMIRPEEYAEAPTSAPGVEITGRDAAYMIYTSGSTGTPKGVLVEHGGFVNMIRAQIAEFGVTASDRALLFASPSFDASLSEVFMGLGAGASLYPVSREQIDDPWGLRAYMTENGVSVATLPPSYLRIFEQAEFPSLRALITAGEAANPSDARHYASSLSYFNAYGPTECSVCATIGKVSADDDSRSISIGRPIANTRVYILSPSGDLLPKGTPGELCVSGPGLARGYWNRPEKTAESFVADPFVAGERMYRTGDRARWLSDGRIEYLGRLDDQTKVRGYRIEPGEIASCAESLPGVRQAVALIDSRDGESSLLLFVVGDVAEEVLRDHLKSKLPAYMIPHRIVSVESIPMTTNGKVNKPALIDYALAHESEETTAYVAPSTESERRLVEIWESILGRSPIGVRDNFFEIGGDSIQAMKVCSRIGRRMGAVVSLRQFFEAETISALAGQLEAIAAIDGDEADDACEICEWAPLTHPQRQLWMAQAMDSESPAYNMPVVIEIETDDELDADAVESALNILVERHESLRSSFDEVDSEPRQTVAESAHIRLERWDVSSSGSPLEDAREIASDLCRTPFDLRAAPLLRAGLVRLSPHWYVLALCLHHIAGDGASVTQLAGELFALLDGADLPTPRRALARLLRDEERYLAGAEAESCRVYWSEQLRGVRPLTELPTDYLRPSPRSSNGSRVGLDLAPELTRALGDLARGKRTSFFGAFLSLVQALLHRYTGNEDITLGIPASPRERYDAQNWVGYLVNPIAMRTRMDGSERFSDLVSRVGDRLLDNLDRSAYPFDAVVESLNVRRDPAHSPVFDVMVVIDELEPSVWNTSGRELRRFDIDFPVAKFDLTFTISSQDSRSPRLMLEYSSDLFSAETARQMLTRLVALMASAVREPDAPLDSLPMMDEGERALALSELSRGPQVPVSGPETMHGLFEAAAAERPDADAVVFEGRRLSYAELDRRANSLANLLRAEGLEREARVAVMGLRSDALVTALLGVMKAGCVYVPVDPAYPKERIEWIIQDSGASAIVDLTGSSELDLPIRMIRPEEYAEASSAPGVAVSGRDAAYMIYTSGSTGTPKGVLVEHGGFVNMIRAQIAEFGVTASDRALLFASPSFDASLSEVFMGLGCGASLYPVSREQIDDPWGLREYMTENGVSVATLPPSYLRIFEQAEFPSLRALITAGEAANPSDARHYASSLSYFNAYGPTECSVCATIGKVNADDDSRSISIGRPIANTRVYILSPSGDLLPKGTPGELCVSGPGLAREYWNRPEKSAESFVADPFVAGERMYRTGDRARWLSDGRIEYLGRLDDQTKVRGYRIEPGEIASCAESLPGVRQAVALIDSRDGESSLLLFVVGDVAEEVLRDHLKSKLPAYMIPHRIVSVESIPMTTNGKVDKPALIEYALAHESEEATAYVAPSTESERRLVEIWESILGRSPIGVRDNFLEIGGDSIQAMRVAGRLHSLGATITARDIFAHPTIADLAKTLPEAVDAVGDGEGSCETVGESIPFTPIQRWFLAKPSCDQTFAQAAYLAAKERIDESAMDSALQAVARHHGALRLRFTGDAQEYAETSNVPLIVDDLRGRADSDSAIAERAAAVIQGLDPAGGAVFAAILFRLDAEDRLYLAASHLVIDAYSWQVILEDLTTAYEASLRGEGIALPAKTSSYGTWAKALNEYSVDPAEQAYWRDVCELSCSALPTQGAVEWLPFGEFRRLSAELDAGTTDALVGSGNQAYRTETVELILAGVAEGLGRCHGGALSRILCESHGREPIAPGLNLNRSVGWFTSVFPFLLDTDPAMELRDRIRSAKERLRGVPTRGIGYGALRYLNAAQGLNAVSQLVFNYLGHMGAAGNDLFSLIADSPAETVGAGIEQDAPVVVTAMVIGGRLRVVADYHSGTLAAETAQSFLDETLAALRRIAEHCAGRGEWELTPSDCALNGMSLTEFDNLLASLDLKPTDVEDVLPLTPSQEAMLYSYISMPDSRTYFEQMEMYFSGPIDPALMKEAWIAAAQPHHGLRSVFQHEALDSPVQVVRRRMGFPIICERAGSDVARIAEEDRRNLFDLSTGPTMRIRMIETEPDKWTILWSFHHIIMDGWCFPIIFGDVVRAYRALLDGKTPEPSPTSSLRDYLKWVGGRSRSETEAFWREYLADYDAATGVPRTPGIAVEPGYRNRTRSLHLGEGETKALAAASASMGVTASTMCEAIWGALLARYNDANDAVFGIVVSGRPVDVPEIASTVGALTMTVPCRVRFDRSESVAAVAKRIQDDSLASVEHHWLSLADVQAVSPLGSNLLNNVMVFENYPMDKALMRDPFPRVRMDGMGGFEQIPYDLGVTIAPDDDMEVRFTYNANAYSDRFIETLGEQYRQALIAATSDPSIAMGALPMVTAGEREEFGLRNATEMEYPKDSTLHELVFAQAERTPDRVAVAVPSAEGESALTYGDVARRARALAKLLVDAGAKPGGSVGVLLSRGERLIPGLLAALSVGACYVPLDPMFPPDRLRYILEDSGASVVLTERSVLQSLGDMDGLAVKIVVVDDYDLDSDDPTGLELPTVDPDEIAYTIYTSGSTGRPKGVRIRHGNMVNFLCSMLREPGLTSDDRLLAVTTVCFDIAGLEMFLSLICGAQVIMASRADASDPGRLAELLDAYGVTVLQATPATWRMLLDDGWSGKSDLRMLVGGEALHSPLAAAMMERGSELWNMYGPTETTVWSTLRRVTPEDVSDEDAVVCIGRPIGNTQVYVLGESGDLLPDGAVGELVIGGDGVGAGYHMRPELTDEKFIRIPEISGGPIYRTGDLVSWNPDGSLSYHGRMDFQVKIRGFRIELGEIESVLQAHPTVREAAVMCVGAADDPRLAAYVVGCGESDVESLRAHARESLPEYMVPSLYIPMDEFPLTPNAKVDRRKLSALGLERLESSSSSGYEPPCTPTEDALAGLFRRILGVQRVGRRDSFTDLGGHSLRAVTLMNMIRREMGVALSLAEILGARSLAELATVVDRTSASNSIERMPDAERYPLSYAQKRLWTLQYMDPGNGAYNIPMAVRLTGPLDPERLDRAMAQVVKRHESLRTRYVRFEGEPWQVIDPPVRSVIEYVDLPADHDAESIAKARVDEEAVRPFDLEREHPLRVALMKTGPDVYVLAATAHHIAFDGWSIQVFFREVGRLYEQPDEPLSPLPIQYRDFAAWQKRRIAGSDADKEYWRRTLGDEPIVLDMPTDHPRPKEKTYNGSRVMFEVEAGDVNRLRALAEAAGTSLFAALTSLVTVLTHRYSRSEDIILGTAVAGREHADLEDQIGMYVNTVALRNRVDGSMPFAELLGRTGFTVKEAFRHQGYPFDLLVDDLKLERDVSRSPVFDVMVTMQNLPEAGLPIQGLGVEPILPELPISKLDLSFTFTEENGGLLCELEFNTDLFEPATIERMRGHFACILESALATPSRRVGDLAMIDEREAEDVVVGFNETRRPVEESSIVSIFRRSVERYAHEPAVLTGARAVTYSELDGMVDALARLIRANGGRRGDVVGVAMNRSLDLVASMHAVMRAGCVYLPLNLDYPDARLRFMVEDSGCGLVIADPQSAERAAGLGARVLRTDAPMPDQAGVFADTPDGSDIAYIIYTSGSTGEPKGVRIEHSSLANYVLWAGSEFGLGVGDVTLPLAAVSFDANVSELVYGLPGGAAIALTEPGNERIPSVLAEAIAAHRVTSVQMTPSLLGALLDHVESGGSAGELSTLRQLVSGGERLPLDLALRFMRTLGEPNGTRLCNAYGPTETTVDAACHWIAPTDLLGGEIPIGRPVANTRIYVLEANGAPTPVGVPGEICVAGASVARDYLNRPEQTAAGFVDDPFVPGERMYRTGDLGRWRADGTVEMLGRIDQQVKLRGYRIELGEIESALRAADGVRQSAVIVEGEPARIVAYMVVDGPLDAASLRSALLERLPEYMVPSGFRLVDEILVTANGKVDYKRLQGSGEPLSADEARGASNAVEESLLEMWREVLGADEAIGVEDNFFEIGGNSLSLVRLHSVIDVRWPGRIGVTDLFRYMTIADQAAALSSDGVGEAKG